MRKISIIILSIFTLTSYSKELEQEKKLLLGGIYFDDMFYIGGNQKRFSLHPFVQYTLHPKLWIAAGAHYKYYQTLKQNAYTYGFNVFANPYIYSIGKSTFPLNIMLHGELDFINLPRSENLNERHWADLYWIGGGIRQQFRKRSNLYIIVIWNLKPVALGPKSPGFRFGITF
jgi:hypothetical protein